MIFQVVSGTDKQRLLHCNHLHLDIWTTRLRHHHGSSRRCIRKSSLIHSLELRNSISTISNVNLFLSALAQTQDSQHRKLGTHRRFHHPLQRRSCRLQDRLYIMKDPIGSHGRRADNEATRSGTCYLRRYIDRPDDFES
jgi:hypothetical protein